MPSINRVTIVGHIGKEPEVTFKGELAICNFSVATSEYKKDVDRKNWPTEWHKVVTFGKTAEMCGQLSKGTLIFIDGKLQTDSYEDRQGVKRSTTKIVANTVVAEPRLPDTQRDNSDVPF